MVFSIVKQSIEIRLGFENPPKINADTECAAAIGILAKLYGLPVPERREDLVTMQKDLETQTMGRPATEQMEKLGQILYAYEPKTAVDDEKYDLLKYSYEQTEKSV
ncbi:DUF3837 family protein [Clostridium sp. AN503]|uniref:DUF3837 family protein n=1 Tax=Clostridium sp. AN503 TaxID=3160598 RepID=UPI00345A65A6